MNLYLVLAIALGAMTGIAEAPVSRPALSTLVAQRAGRAHRRGIRTPLGAEGVSRTLVSLGIDRTVATPRCDSPLTGGATPRAPAIG